MGTYRILNTTLRCRRCDASHRVAVQFKTGHDRAMPEYEDGDLIPDVEPGVYEGIVDAYCPPCMSRWVGDEKRLHFDLLADDVAAGRVVARRATWRNGELDGRPELGVVVTLEDEAPMTADAVRALAQVPERPHVWPGMLARLGTAHVALWRGDVRVFPEETSIESPSTDWWRLRCEQVAARLAAMGWLPDGSQWIDVPVIVDAERRVRLGP